VLAGSPKIPAAQMGIRNISMVPMNAIADQTANILAKIFLIM
jgi:hypothetical protein